MERKKADKEESKPHVFEKEKPEQFGREKPKPETDQTTSIGPAKKAAEKPQPDEKA